MAANEPAYLPVGTDVSAKYRGAFCEAKVKKLVRSVKCKVVLKETQTSVIVNDENLKGTLKIGSVVEIKHPDTGQIMEAAISKLTDQSMYTVVFDDGDEKTLRRTQLCLKGEKHFIESETLDNLPLSHPEHFGTPVLQTKSRKRTAKMGSPGFNTLYLAQEDTDTEESSSEESSPKRASYRAKQQELVGKVMYMESGDKRKGGINPVLVVLPDASSIDLKTKDHMLVRSFRDGKFVSVLKKELKDFTRDTAIKNEDKTLKTAIEKALLYYDNHELPGNWKREELLGSDDEADMDDDDSSDDEPSEEKDRFVAQLYKFMDDRGTPINKGPSIGNSDLNLYKLFRVVQNLGGYNRVTNQMKWRLVYSKMVLPQSNTASHQIKNAYKKFLHAFEDFYRKLGSTMGTISRPGRSRHNSGRSILPFRGRDKESPRSPRSVKSKDSDKEDSDRGGKSRSDVDSQSEDGKDMDEDKEETPGGKDESERKERTTPRRMLRDDLKEAKEKEREAKKKKEEKEEQARQKKDEDKEVKSKKEEANKGKKEEKKVAEEERKSSRKEKQEDKVDSKKEDVKTDRETRGQKDKQKDESKVEKEKPKKKEREKEEVEEESKEEEDKTAKKQRVTRRKSGRGDDGKKDVEMRDESEERKIEEKKKKEEGAKTKKDDKKDVKKEDKKDVKKEDKIAEKDKKKEDKKEDKKKEESKGEKEKKKEEKKEKKQKEKKQEDEESDENEDDEPEEITLRRSREEYPTGTKLKVRYGRGRNQKIYEAKVVESNKEGSQKTYLVHYAGWNNRYDEWVKPDRIISVVNRPDTSKIAVKKSVKTPSPKPASSSLLKKRGRPTGNTSPSPGSGSPGVTSTEFRTPPPKSRSPAPGSGQSSKTRPTRSNSLDNQVVEGIQPKRLTRRSSGITESHASDESGGESDGDETEKIVVVVEEHRSDKDGDESDVKESEHDTSLDDVTEDPDTSIEEKDTDVSHDEPATPVVEDTMLHCAEEMLKSEEEDMDVTREQTSKQEEKKAEEKVKEVAEVKEIETKEISIPEEVVEKKDEEEKVLETSAPELVAEKPFKEIAGKGVNEKTDNAAEEAMFEASEALLQMPTLHEAFMKLPEEQSADMASEVKKQESSPPMPEIKKMEPKKIDPELPKKEKDSEKKERGRKPKKDLKDGGKKQKAPEPPSTPESKPAEPHVMTPQEARMKAALDLYDFHGFEEPEEELVLRRDKKSEPFGRRLLALDKEVKPEVIESGEMEKKKVKKKVKKKEDECKKESEVKDWFAEGKKDAEKKEHEAKRDNGKEGMKGKGAKGEKCAKKEPKKKDTKVEGDQSEGSKEKKEKRPRSRSSSPVESCSKSLKTEHVDDAPKPSTSASAEPASAIKTQEQEDVDKITELSMNTMLENTPPTTPEHEANIPECVPPMNLPERQPETKDSVSEETMTKVRSVSPSLGECSASSSEANENNSAVQTSESSNDNEPASAAVGKRKRESLDQTTPSKKKKRAVKGGKGSEKKSSKTVQGSDSDEANHSKYLSPIHVPSPMKVPESHVGEPRPPKFNFNLEEGNYLEGEKRISFLVDKMTEIRKIYMNLKQEVACIDRRRKRAKRKERENSQSSQLECDSS